MINSREAAFICHHIACLKHLMSACQISLKNRSKCSYITIEYWLLEVPLRVWLHQPIKCNQDSLQVEYLVNLTNKSWVFISPDFRRVFPQCFGLSGWNVQHSCLAVDRLCGSTQLTKRLWTWFPTNLKPAEWKESLLCLKVML